jgi:hypothetical protein
VGDVIEFFSRTRRPQQRPIVEDSKRDDEVFAPVRGALTRYFAGDASKIAAALDEYEGSYPDVESYVRRALEEHLEPYMRWLLVWTDINGIAEDWLARGRNWLLTDEGEDDAVHVFLSSRPAAAVDEHEIDLETSSDEPDAE